MKNSKSLLLFLVFLPWVVTHAQVAAGGGGLPTAEQYVTVQPPFDSGIFTRPGRDLTAAERTQRNAAWRAEIRKQLFIPDTLPALQPKVWSTFSPTAGVLADRVTYATADGMRVPAIVYRPDPKTTHFKGKLPGIVLVTGHGGDKFSWYAFYGGMLFAKAGAVVVTYDPLGSGERNSARTPGAYPSEHDAFVDTPHWGQRLGGLMQVDVMQGVTYLQSLPQVDASRIGVAGFSMGAFIAGITGAIDLRIHAVLLSGGGVLDAPHEYYDRNKLPCQTPPYLALSVLGDRGPILYALHAERGPTFVMNGDADTVMRLADHPPAWFDAMRVLTIEKTGSETNLFTTVLYPGISHRANWMNLDGMLWLNQQLHFAFWNDAAIRSAGTTHIAAWSRANNVDIPPTYLREDRDGGMDAVGTGLPSIPHADLMALPDAEWQKQKDQLIYAGWAAKMHALEGR